MKTINITKKIFAAIAICIFAASAVNAQTPDQNNNINPPPVSGTPAPTPPPVNNMPAPPPPQPGLPIPAPQQQLQQISTFSGSFVKLVTNDDYVYDGFYLLSNGDSLLIKFPPHLGKQITDITKSGEQVTVTGVLTINPSNAKEVRMISVKAGNHAEIKDTSTVAAITPPVETYTSGNGKITKLQTNREGIVVGFIVDDKTILRVPPPVVNQLSNSAQSNASVAYTGMKKAVNTGEVSEGDYTIVHCNTLTLNGQQYLVQ